MRVTVGISFYNNERTLPDAIRSVFAQTFQDWELILIDDGSTDSSLRIAQSINSAHVRVFSDGENKGAPYRLNQINQLARGDYIARMDGDDIMHPERFTRQVEYLDANPAVDIVSNGIYIIDSDNRLVGIRGLKPLDASPAAALKRGILVQGTAMGRAEWWRRFPYDTSYTRAEENELWARSCRTSTYGKIYEPLYFCRENSKSPMAYLRDYLKSGRTLRTIYHRYGPAYVGWPQTAALMATSYLKCGAYAIATALGAQSRLFGKRNRPLTETEEAEAAHALSIVAGASVPGLESSELIGASEWKKAATG